MIINPDTTDKPDDGKRLNRKSRRTNIKYLFRTFIIQSLNMFRLFFAVRLLAECIRHNRQDGELHYPGLFHPNERLQR